MKKTIIVFTQLFLIHFCFSQDIITKKNGDDIKAKVIEVNQTEIKYKKNGATSGPTYTINKNEILMIHYEDGSKEIFKDQSEKYNNSRLNKSEEMADKGKDDAKAYYKGKNSGAVWTTVTTILTSPIVGAIPAIVCSSTEPSDENLNYIKEELMKDPDYNRSYTQQAYKIKKKKIWSSFGIGSAVWLVLVIIAGSSGG